MIRRKEPSNLGVALVVAFLLGPSIVCSINPSFGAEADAAKRAYEAGYELEQQGKLAEAAEAYQNVVEQHPQSRVKLATLGQLAGVRAVLGKTEEAFQTYVRYIEDDLAAAKTPPAERPGSETIRAQARWKVANALLGSRRTDRCAVAKAQYEILVRDFPNSPLAPAAKKKINWLGSLIEKQASQAVKKEAIKAVITAYGNALKKKNAAAALALLAVPPENDQLRNRLQSYFGGPQYKAYDYKARQFRFSPDMSKATVITDALPAGEPDGQPVSKLFRLVKTPGGWKLARL